MTFDPYYAHHFSLDKDQAHQTSLATYYANNET